MTPVTYTKNENTLPHLQNNNYNWTIFLEIIKKCNKSFLPHDAMLVRYMLSSCVSVHPSIHHMLARCIKTSQLRIMQITLHDSLWTDTKDLSKIWSGSPQWGHQMHVGWVTIGNFPQI